MLRLAALLLLCALWLLVCLNFRTVIATLSAWGVLPQAALLLVCGLWLLLCLRFYTLIARRNVWQRRLIALGAGLGAGLIYVLGSMTLSLFRPAAEPRALESAGDVQIRGR